MSHREELIKKHYFLFEIIIFIKSNSFTVIDSIVFQKIYKIDRMRSFSRNHGSTRLELEEEEKNKSFRNQS